MFLVVNPNSEDLLVRVLDTAKKDAVIGQTVVRISDIVSKPDMEMPTQVWTKEQVKII